MKAKSQPINHTVQCPEHYCFSDLEPISVIESWSLNFSLGNCIKYICRAGKKNNVIEDLKKAQWYLDREINRLEENV